MNKDMKKIHKDWVCPNKKCNTLNKGTRHVCYICKIQNPAFAVSRKANVDSIYDHELGLREKHWICTKCQGLNKGTHLSCIFCHNPHAKHNPVDIKPATDSKKTDDTHLNSSKPPLDEIVMSKKEQSEKQEKEKDKQEIKNNVQPQSNAKHYVHPLEAKMMGENNVIDNNKVNNNDHNDNNDNSNNNNNNNNNEETQSIPMEWNCLMCTYINEPNVIDCAMCGLPKTGQ